MTNHEKSLKAQIRALMNDYTTAEILKAMFDENNVRIAEECGAYDDQTQPEFLRRAAANNIDMMRDENLALGLAQGVCHKARENYM